MANKVWVAVVPNTKNFASDLRKFLNRVEKTLELIVDVRADTTAAEDEVRAAVARMGEHTATINVDADTSRAERRVKDVAGKRGATVNVDADTGLASTQIAYVTRRRTVELALQLSKGSLAKVGAALAGLSGARVLQSTFSSLGSSLANLDRSVPAITGLALSIGSIGSVALSSVSGIVTLGASLAPLAALAAPLPGLLLAGGAAIGVFAAAMKDAGTELGSLKGGFAKLQDSISGAFWEKAKQPILDMVNGVLPSLQSGLTKVSSSLGTWSASVAKSFQTAFSPEVIGTITGQLAASIDASTQGTDAFAASLAALGTFAAQYLPGIGNWFSDISLRFNDFIQTVVSNGQLAGWVQEASAVLGQLAAVASNAFGIVGNVADAAFAAGGSGLQTLAGALAAINQVTSTPVFQGALTTLFEGAAEGASGLSAALGPIGNMLEGLAPAISGALAGLGATAGDLIGGIAAALNQPMVATGLTTLVAGINAGIHGLLPSLPALAAAFGSIMGVVGQLAGVLGPVLGAALSAVAPLITALAAAVVPVIQMLGPALTQVIMMLAPLVMQLAQAFQPLVAAVLPLLSALLAAVMPPITALLPAFTALIPIVVQIVQALSAALIPVIQALMPVVMAVVNAIVPIIQSLVTVIQGVVNVIAGLLTGNFAQAWQGAQQIVSGVWGVITGVISGALNIIGSVITAGLNIVRTIFGTVWNGVASVVSGVVGNIVGFVRNMASGIGSGVTSAVQFFSGLPGRIMSALANLGGMLASVGRNLMQGFIDGVSGFGQRLLSAVTAPIKDAIAGAKSLLGIHSPSRVFRDEIGKQLVAGFALGITGNADMAHSAIDDLAGYRPSASLTGTASFPSASRSAFGAAGALPDSITLLDQDGSILARTRVIASDTVASSNRARAVSLQAGTRRR